MSPLSNISLIQLARVASPCDMKWSDMTGDDTVRHCESCNLNVYKFANMTAVQANAILEKAEGRICGQLWRRADGTVLTRDCPVGLAAVRRKVVFAVAKMTTAVMIIGTAFAYGRSRDADGRNPADTAFERTSQSVDRWLNGSPPPQTIASGGMIDIWSSSTSPGNDP